MRVCLFLHKGQTEQMRKMNLVASIGPLKLLEGGQKILNKIMGANIY